MNATDIIKIVEQQGATIKRHGDVLEVVNGQCLPPETVNLLKQHKPDLMAHLLAGDARLIEPLDHSNDEPVLTIPMHRALNGLDYLMNQKRHNLRNNDYSESNAMVSREEWRTVVMRVLHINWQDMDVLEDKLYRVGAYRVLSYVSRDKHISDNLNIQTPYSNPHFTKYPMTLFYQVENKAENRHVILMC